MNRNFILFFLLTVASYSVWGQDRYVAFFSDKEGTSYTVDAPLEFLTERSVTRRTNQGISITEDDLPVNAAYVAAVESAGAAVFYTSRWMNAVMFQGTTEIRDAVAALDMVDSVWYIARGPVNDLDNPNAIPEPPYTVRKTMSTHLNADQNAMLGVDVMHAQGYHGEGMLIAIFDGGFEGADTAAAFSNLIENHLYHTFDFVGNRTYPFGYDDHGTRALSTMAALGLRDGDTTYLGTAYEADYILCVTEDVPVEYRVEEFNWLFAAELADSLGVDIIHTSLGYSDGFSDFSMSYTTEDMDGETTIIARASQFAVDRGILVVTSAGNSGSGSWGIVTSPADVPNVLAVGAIEDTGERASFSSRGPGGNILKPDVVALGVSVSLVNAAGIVTRANGTSYSAPQVAGMAAGLWQAFPELTNLELLNLLRAAGDQANQPDSLRGYGLPSFTMAQYLHVVSLSEPNVVELSVFPNPVKGNSLSISLTKEFQAQALDITRYNTQGQEIFVTHIPVHDGLVSISTQDWPSGTYLLRIQCEGTLGWARVVKP